MPSDHRSKNRKPAVGSSRVPDDFKSARMRSVAFLVLVSGASVAGRLMDGDSVDVLAPQPGQALWLAAPLLVASLLTLLADRRPDWGLRPRLSTAGPWYLLALVIFPAATAVLVAVGRGFGAIHISSGLALGTLAGAVLLAIPAALIKNVFEELAWRGYLMGELSQLLRSRLGLHLAVGAIWGLWHLPYLDAFSEVYHDASWVAYGPLFLLGVLPTAVVYGEVRLRSGSVWPAVIMHTMANAAVNTLFVDDYVSLESNRFWTVGPAVDNLGYIVVMTFIAAVLYNLPHRDRSGLGG